MAHTMKVQMFGNFRMEFDGVPLIAEKMHKESQFNRLMQVMMHYSRTGIPKDKLEEQVIGERDIDDDFLYEPHVVTEVVAFADCAPEDEFDEVLGKKIALTRAQSGAFDTAAYIYERIQDIFLKAANEIDIRLENTIESIDKCNKHVDTLIERTYSNDSE